VLAVGLVAKEREHWREGSNSTSSARKPTQLGSTLAGERWASGPPEPPEEVDCGLEVGCEQEEDCEQEVD